MAQGPTHSLARLGNELVNQAGEYARLMRLDRPVGTWLLLWPTLWGLWIAGAGRPEPVNFLVFVAGVFVMRSAGCVINDFADRDIDSEVERTQSRPLAAGRVTPAEALTLFAVLGLQLLAIRFGEVKMAITNDQAQALRAQLKKQVGALETVIVALDEPARQVAEAISGKALVEFVGAGPNYAVAGYGAAKLLEASGRHAVACDLEEWAHLNYFDRAPVEIATVLIVPEGSVAQGRAVELAAYMHKLGRSLIVVGGGEVAEQTCTLGHTALPVPVLDERWSPLLTSVAPALIAAHLSALDGAEYGRGGKAPWDDSVAAATVQQSAIWESAK